MPAALSRAALGRGTQAEGKLRPAAREGLNPPGTRVLGLEVDPPVPPEPPDETAAPADTLWPPQGQATKLHSFLTFRSSEMIKVYLNPLSPGLENEMATHSSILSWKIPWTEEPGGLQSMGSQRVRHDRATSLTHSPLG